MNIEAIHHTFHSEEPVVILAFLAMPENEYRNPRAIAVVRSLVDGRMFEAELENLRYAGPPN